MTTVEQGVRDILTAVVGDRELWTLLRRGVDPQRLTVEDLRAPANALTAILLRVQAGLERGTFVVNGEEPGQ